MVLITGLSGGAIAGIVVGVVAAFAVAAAVFWYGASATRCNSLLF